MPHLETLLGENRRLVTDEPVHNWLNLEISGESPVILDESMENIPQMNESKTGT